MRLCSVLAALFILLELNGNAYAVGTSAQSSVLMDANSGRILYQSNADEQRLIASITKIMTAVVALEQGEIDSVYTVTWDDMAEGSSMYLKPGEEITLEELLYGLMLASGNDAARAVAHCVAGDVESFVSLMNQKTKELGLTRTSFANPNGLDAPQHYSTARDMAVLTAYAMQNETFRRLVSTVSVTINDRTLVNHNKLLEQYDGCVGVKTGYTKAAGRTLVSAAERSGQLLIAVTLSDGNDWQDHKNLLDYGFSSYPRRMALQRGTTVGSAAVKGSAVMSIPVVAAESFYFPLSAEEEVEITFDYYEQVTAPILKGTILGEAIVSFRNNEIGRVPLIAGADVSLAITGK